jgi:hypothetical protein
VILMGEIAKFALRERALNAHIPRRVGVQTRTLAESGGEFF